MFPPRKFLPREGVHVGSGPVHEKSDVADLPAQGFRIRIDNDAIWLEASDMAGLFYARQALTEVVGQCPEGEVPCCLVEDWPDFKHRGYMLDISRDRVPTMDHLFHLVDQLAKLRYNQLQLYTEHTFAYPGHETVWAQASPMTGAEIRELDDYCRRRHIELVPNQNSFGHMERWLEHDAYRHLAECPEGFRHPLSGEWRPQGSVIKPDGQSLEFLDGLYCELLPNFSSRKFNIGGDEPWELGEGASADQVATEGKHKVYAEFLARICRLATAHGAEPMCWADVLLENPEQIKGLPPSIQPIIWGYEADHPFAEQCALLADLGREYYVAPGDSTWTSYTGRFSNMRRNVRQASRIGLENGASGLLMTHWGDGGHPQPWPVSLPGMVWAGLLSWNSNTDDSHLEHGLRSLLGDDKGTFVQVLMAVGGVDETLGVKLVNRSYLAHVNQMGDSRLRDFEPRPDAASIRQLIRDCEDWLDTLGRVSLGGREAGLLQDELELAVRLNLYAAKRCLGEAQSAPAGLRELYQRCWLARSRPGGLQDSLAKIHGMRA